MGENIVFVCDDDTGISDMLALIIESTGIPVYVENNSTVLYEKLQEVKPRVLIIDLWMPVLSGDQIIRQLRADRSFDDLYIVCISASMHGEKTAMDAGANRFIAKPFDIADIISVISGELPSAYA
ncbi:response regulator [Sphingobacterium paludis]|jgi:DNA-binding response OmpR family regulator|uniref:Response regulator receiver domain-containing protein n=1 Tax=Sphingobacterium paludis TaxID=1476465 RepID=A0A4R7CWS3_9SPHI|nr:response regulator [Sphingobacterium paludis]TDS12963.1 response regulator receiver domain-containing protein [Sphingobacterium paludis]